MLAGHRLAAVETTEIQARYPRRAGRNARLGPHGRGGRALAVTVRTDTGHSGWGMLEGPSGDLHRCVGRPLDELLAAEAGVIDPEAANLDVALHDLAARILGRPLHRMLGGRGPTTVPCYSGAIYFDDLDPEDAPRGIRAVLDGCAADWAAGYRAFKLKIGRGYRWMEAETGFARDIEVTRRVREAYPGAVLMVDANNGFTPQRTIDYLRAVADCELYWIEEPFPEHEDGLRVLREFLAETDSSVRVADGEHEPDVDQVLALAEAGLLDVALMDVLSFSLTAWRRLMPRLAQLGVAASPHAWGHPVKTAYAAQLAAGLGNIAVVEGVPGITEGVDASAFALVGGALEVPEVPGSGLELSH